MDVYRAGVKGWTSISTRSRSLVVPAISLSAREKEVPVRLVLGPGLFVESRDGLVKAVQRPLVPFLFPHEHGVIGNALGSGCRVGKPPPPLRSGSASPAHRAGLR